MKTNITKFHRSEITSGSHNKIKVVLIFELEKSNVLNTSLIIEPVAGEKEPKSPNNNHGTMTFTNIHTNDHLSILIK